MKVKKRSRKSFNQARIEEEATSQSFISQQRRQQAFEQSTQLESSKFELMSELSSTTILDSQSSVRKIRQRDDQRNKQEERIEDISKAIMSVFQI